MPGSSERRHRLSTRRIATSRFVTPSYSGKSPTSPDDPTPNLPLVLADSLRHRSVGAAQRRQLIDRHFPRIRRLHAPHRQVPTGQGAKLGEGQPFRGGGKVVWPAEIGGSVANSPPGAIRAPRKCQGARFRGLGALGTLGRGKRERVLAHPERPERTGEEGAAPYLTVAIDTVLRALRPDHLQLRARARSRFRLAQGQTGIGGYQGSGRLPIAAVRLS